VTIQQLLLKIDEAHDSAKVELTLLRNTKTVYERGLIAQGKAEGKAEAFEQVATMIREWIKENEE
jgi:hypothetical protein